VRLALQQSAEIYAYVLLIYFAIAFVITRLMRVLERRLKAGIGKAPQPATSTFRRAEATGVGATGGAA
jgi:polar amino acid transport system permease protein